MQRSDVRPMVLRAVTKTLRKAIELDERMSFIGDLEYDSLRVASLSIALESEFGQPILLNDWLVGASDPMTLTVGSLTTYITELFREEA